jgi:hypothetical protein
VTVIVWNENHGKGKESGEHNTRTAKEASEEVSRMQLEMNVNAGRRWLNIANANGFLSPSRAYRVQKKVTPPHNDELCLDIQKV